MASHKNEHEYNPEGKNKILYDDLLSIIKSDGVGKYEEEMAKDVSKMDYFKFFVSCLSFLIFTDCRCCQWSYLQQKKISLETLFLVGNIAKPTRICRDGEEYKLMPSHITNDGRCVLNCEEFYTVPQLKQIALDKLWNFDNRGFFENFKIEFGTGKASEKISLRALETTCICTLTTKMLVSRNMKIYSTIILIVMRV